MEEYMVFHPVPYVPEAYEPMDAQLKDAWAAAVSATEGIEELAARRVPMEDAWFESADGTALHGWLARCAEPRAVVLYCHGNAGNISYLRSMLEDLTLNHQLTVLAFDYRGYGRSEGIPNEQGILDDARAARAWLAEHAGIGEREIVLMGRSLGGGVAVDLAAKDGARGLILESTFTSMPEVAAEHVKVLPLRSVMRTRLNSLAKIADYHGPLLQSHGDADRLIPYAMGRKLHEAAPGPKRFVTITGGDHNDAQSTEYFQALDEFIASLPPPSGR
ncbi:MAG: alpha/beta hydrolase [Planctomycetes bacterium]|nr:alpha/beta hydrolase [Planctomycetota bacterium]